MKRLCLPIIAVTVFLGSVGQALAWGATGHHMISAMAAERLPAILPAFLRTQDMPFIIGELGRELDRSKGSGETHDKERDPGHYVDLDDKDKVMGGPALMGLPATREAYDTDLRKVGKTQYKAGYLPYSIVGGWQQLTKDFGYWRGLVAAEEKSPNRAKAAEFARDRKIREMLIVRDLGVWSHYVGDASQPLHVSVHYNGWGNYPNPDGYSTSKNLHSYFEGAFVRKYITEADVARFVPAPRQSNAGIWKQTETYIKATHDQVVPLYELEKQNAFNGTNAAGKEFVAKRLAAAVGELRDLVVAAWKASATIELGWPPITLERIEHGADPSSSFFGKD